MKKLLAVATLALFLTGCSEYAYSGYNPYNDPLGVTTRTEIREREATKRQDIITTGDVTMKQYDSQARSDEAYYKWQEAESAASAQRTQAHMDAIKSTVWAGITPVSILIAVLGMVLVVALIQVARVLTTSEFVPPLPRDMWHRNSEEL